MLLCGFYLPIPASHMMKLLTERCLAQDVSAKAKWASIVHTIFQLFPICATVIITSSLNIRLLLIARQLRKGIGPAEISRPSVHSSRGDNATGREGGEPSTSRQVDVGRAPDMNRNRPRRRGMKGFATILFLTANFCLVWTPVVINALVPLHPIYINIFDTLSGSYTWVQPVIYLLSNSEARKLCLVAFRKCPSHFNSRIQI